ncbi:MAG: hypothetical protein HY926_01465 [Elusimicrobia bacterium]|nr:hypothetical protein [Elusimicrobiota bacterium]
MAFKNTVAPAVAVPASEKNAELDREAAAILVDSLIEGAEEAVRQDSHREFYAANHSKALVIALAALKDRCEAEDAVAQTYVELLKGRTRPACFFHALRCNILDRKRRLRREQSLFEPADLAFDSRNASGEDRLAGGDSEEFAAEPASPQPEDQDPLAILVQREEAAARLAMVERAMADPRWRYVKGRKWARPLVGDVRK